MEDGIILAPEWPLKDEKGKGICNFVPEVLGKIDFVDCTGKRADTLLKLRLSFANGMCDEREVLLSKLDSLAWTEIDQSCIFNPRYRRANVFIGMLIRSKMSQVPAATRIILEETGIKKINGEIAFAAGDRVITRSPDSEFNLDFDTTKIPFRLDIDPNLTPKKAFDGMIELISLSPELGRVLVAHVVSGIMGAAFKEAGFSPCAVLVVVGKSGMLKSHYIPHLVQLYNRRDGVKAVTRVNSTQRFIEDILCEYCECTAVIDDLHSAESNGIKKRNEETVEEIIRRISDDTGRGHREGGKLVQNVFRGNVVFIGEYTIGKESTIPRALVIELTHKPNAAVLDKHQRQCPLIVSTFYYYFMQWYVRHYEDVRNEIDEELTQLRKAMVHSELHGRLCDTKFYLQISYACFLEFCRESEFVSEEDAIDEYKEFCSELDAIILAQQARFKAGNKEKGVDYLGIVRQLYQDGRFCVAKRKENFNPDKHDGIRYYECLCVRGKRLERKLKSINADFQLDDCVKELCAKGALKLVDDKNTVQISGMGGKRFYAIKLSKLGE